VLVAIQHSGQADLLLLTLLMDYVVSGPSRLFQAPKSSAFSGGLPYLLGGGAGGEHPFGLHRWGEGVDLAQVEGEPGILEADDPFHPVEQLMAGH
jgi:hypothetical protein